MSKLVSLLLVCMLLFSLTACGGGSRPSNASSTNSSNTSQPQSGTQAEAYTPQLSEEFYKAVTLHIFETGDVDVNNLQFSDGTMFFDDLWPFVFYDAAASQDGHPSKYDLLQYKNNSVGYVRYDIPADVYVQAMQSWYGCDFDVSTLHTMTESGLENALPTQPRVAYNPDADIVYVTVDGIGSDGHMQIDNVEITSEDRVVTAVVTVSFYEMGGESNEPISTPSCIIVLRENEDQTYSLIQVERQAE